MIAEDTHAQGENEAGEEFVAENFTERTAAARGLYRPERPDSLVKVEKHVTNGDFCSAAPFLIKE